MSALAIAAAAAAGLLLAGPVSGAPSGPRAAAESWSRAFEPRAQLDTGGRMIVVLAAPSLADRVAASKRRLGAREQRAVVREVEDFQRRLLAALGREGIAIRPERRFTRTLDGFSAVLGPRAVGALERAPGVVGVYPVRAVYPALEAAVPLPEVPLGPSGLPAGPDGSGVDVALLDGGVDLTHEALRGRVLPGIDLAGGGVSPEANPDDAAQLETHGTRMAGILASVAPGARVLPIRVLGWLRGADGGYHVLGRGDLLLAGLERAVDPNGDGAADDAARIALAPLVEPYAAFADSPEARAVAGALQLGTLVVAAAGNDGPASGLGTIGAPGGAPAALTVGAADLTREVAASVAPFSSRGPAFGGNVKPDVVAAGVGVAAADPGASAPYAAVTGSSAAAAVVAAAAAIVAEARPHLDAVALRGVLVGSARTLGEPVTSEGAGLVDPAAAVSAGLVAEPATLALAAGSGRSLRVRNISSRTLRVRLAPEPGARLRLAVRPRALTLRPGASGAFEVAARRGARPPASVSGALLVRARGLRPARVPWVLVAGDPGRLVRDVRVSAGAPASPGGQAVLSFRAGRAGESAAGIAVEPVGLLEVELWTAGGRRLGVLARLHDLLPGRYSIGLTGRGPDGRLLAPGRYEVRLRAHAVGAGEGAASVASAGFAVRGTSR